jgi:hypothetical protein
MSAFLIFATQSFFVIAERGHFFFVDRAIYEMCEVVPVINGLSLVDRNMS